jgi:hypothetical protein
VIVPGEVVQLFRFAGGDYQHLWALAWKKGEREEDENEKESKPEEEDHWFHPEDYLVRNSPVLPGDGWVKVAWREFAADAQYPWFLRECPNCRETRAIRSDSVTRQSFGLITPYSLTSILRVAALEELSRQADPSTDPVARLLPGQGRKLITFSDSRSGAARLSLSFQNFWVEAALAKLLPEVVKDSVDPQKLERWCREYEHQNAVLPPQQRSLPLQKQVQLLQDQLQPILQAPDFEAFCCILAGKLEENQAGRVLEISGENYEDLDPKWAAGVLILEALRRVGRNSTMVRGRLGLGLCGFNYGHTDFQRLFSEHQVPELLSAALFNLYKRAKVAVPLDTLWIPDEINRPTEWGGERVLIAQTRAGEGGMSFVTDESGAFHKLISRALLETVAWEGSVRQYLKHNDPLRDLVVAGFCKKAAELISTDLRALVTGARFLPQTQQNPGWERLMNAASLPVNNGEQGKRYQFKTLLRSKVSELVATILKNFWRQLTPTPTANANKGLTPEQGGQRYRLNPKPLKLIQLNGAAPGDPVPYELEYRNQCDRVLIFARAEEHTAQLSSRAGAAYQRAFTNGSINLLSCSTTFEMGVDLGDLSIVFLANLPPFELPATRGACGPPTRLSCVCDDIFQRRPSRPILLESPLGAVLWNTKGSCRPS